MDVAATRTQFTSRDVGCLRLVRSIFGISNIRRVHGNLCDRSGVSYPNRVIWAGVYSSVVAAKIDGIWGLRVFLGFYWSITKAWVSGTYGD